MKRTKLPAERAIDIMRKSDSVAARAVKYNKIIKRNLKKRLLDPLNDLKDQLEDKIDNLKDFSLDTNLNAGVKRIDREDCEKRFADLIQARYDLTVLKLEIGEKTAIFKELFGKIEEEDDDLTDDTSDNEKA